MRENTRSVGSDDLAPPEAPEGADQTDDGRPGPTWLVVALVVSLAVIAGLVAVLVWPDDDDTVTDPTPTTEAPGTTADTTVPCTPHPPPNRHEAVARASRYHAAVFPDAAGDTRYDDPSRRRAPLLRIVVSSTGVVTSCRATPGPVRSRCGPVRTSVTPASCASWVRTTRVVLGSAPADSVVRHSGGGDAIPRRSP